jgi:hypothetical protein
LIGVDYHDVQQVQQQRCSNSSCSDAQPTTENFECAAMFSKTSIAASTKAAEHSAPAERVQYNIITTIEHRTQPCYIYSSPHVYIVLYVALKVKDIHPQALSPSCSTCSGLRIAKTQTF